MASAEDEDAIHVRNLISQIAASAGGHSLTRSGNNRSDQILLDADFDGDRYLLIRIPLAPRQRQKVSSREWQIARMVAQGHSNKKIAVLLNVSLWTVGSHVRRIFAKLGVNSRAAMVARLLEDGEKRSAGLSSSLLDQAPPLRLPDPQTPPRCRAPVYTNASITASKRGLTLVEVSASKTITGRRIAAPGAGPRR